MRWVARQSVLFPCWLLLAVFLASGEAQGRPLPGGEPPGIRASAKSASQEIWPGPVLADSWWDYFRWMSPRRLFSGGILSRDRVIQVCVVIMCLALFLILKK